jgi:hypothetical protein
MLGLKVFEFLRQFQPGTHVIFLYDDQDSKRELLFSHLRYGRNTEGLAYICSEEDPQSIREGLGKFGIDDSPIMGKPRLKVANYDEVYIVNGKVLIPEIIKGFSGMVDDCRARGMMGLRASAEMGCFFEHDKVEQLIDYEVALRKNFAFDAEGICAYNISQMSRFGRLDVLMPLVRAHDTVIFSSSNGFLVLKAEKVRMKHAEMLLSQATIRE